MESFDVIVVGGGHNGLIAGSYLQKLGFQVCIVEQHRKIGGGVMSEELTLPGFVHDTGAVTHQRIRNSPLIKDDELGLTRKYGLEYIIPEIPLAALFEDWSSILVHRDLEKTVQSISRISKEDAIAYKKFNEWGENLRKLMNRIADAQEPLREIDIEFRSFFARVSFPPLVEQFLTPNKLVNRSPEIRPPWLFFSYPWEEENRDCKADRVI